MELQYLEYVRFTYIWNGALLASTIEKTKLMYPHR
jgi:hypothetical protein